jgi:acyl-homoserine lactone acylase PvdQ
VFRFWRLACNELPPPVGRDSFTVPNTPEVRRDALQALQSAARRLHETYGRVAVPWGEIKRMRRGGREWALSGDGLGRLGMDTLRATAADKLDHQNKMIPTGGQCVTTVVMLTNPPTIRAVVTNGQSNKPGSKHFADQAPLYSDERFREVPWTLEQLRPVVESETTYRYNP